MPAFGWQRGPFTTPSSTLTQGTALSASTISPAVPILQQNPRTTSAGGGIPLMGEWSGSDGITTSLRAAGCMFAGTKLSSTNFSASLRYLPAYGGGRCSEDVDNQD